MSSRSRNTITYTISDFHCTCCGAKGIPVPRKASRQREHGHLKKLYCLPCKAETNHIEVRPFDYDIEQFIKDLKEGKFKEENTCLNV
jgi:hypothetical protein